MRKGCTSQDKEKDTITNCIKLQRWWAKHDIRMTKTRVDTASAVRKHARRTRGVDARSDATAITHIGAHLLFRENDSTMRAKRRKQNKCYRSRRNWISENCNLSAQAAINVRRGRTTDRPSAVPIVRGIRQRQWRRWGCGSN